MRGFVLFAVFGFFFYDALSQGTIRGVISDETGELIVGANIYLKSDPSLGTISDLDGNYSLKIPTSSSVTAVFSFISYQTEEEEITLRDGEVRLLSVTLMPTTLELEDVVIVGKAKRENDSYMRMKKLNSPVSLDYISKETIRKTGDSYIHDAIRRITGVSMVNGYVTVRGLADRYIRTTINGFTIPTLDPLTNNIKLDMFPTALVDNIVIAKTLNPDLPGDWAGSFLSIETKDYPEKFMVNIKTSFAYNPQSSFTNVLTTERSSTDWLGYDNGFRDVKLYDKEDYPYYQVQTSPYDEFRALGLGEYLDRHGITVENLPRPATSNMDYFLNNIYYRMGLVELGLLAPGYIDNENEVMKAINRYYSDPGFKQKAHMAVNTGAAEFGASLPDNWMHTTRKENMGISQDVVIGNQFNIFSRPFGFVAGFRYASLILFDPNTTKDIGIFSIDPANLGEFVPTIEYERRQSTEINQWSAVLNAAYKISPNHGISFLFMPNMTGINSVKADSGFNKYAASNYDFLEAYSFQQYYEERKQFIYQFTSSHYFPNPEIRVEFGVGYTDGESNTPDFKTLKYGRVLEGYQFRQYYRPSRNFRYLDENVLEGRFSLELPFFQKPGLPRKFKMGGQYIRKDRVNKQYLLEVEGSLGNEENHSSPEKLVDNLDSERFAEYDTMTNSLYHNYAPLYLPTDFTKGISAITAGFAMLDFSILPGLRLTGGVRVERTEIYTDVGDFYNKNIPANDPGRITELPGFGIRLYANPSSMDTISILPSVNLVYKLFNTDYMASNLRLSYSQAIGRPTIREISAYYDFNYDVGNWILGNPNLKIVNINNYDLRLENYFASGDNISISLFYKEFENHIELANENAYFTWRNAPGLSKARGIEVEGRKQFLRFFEFMGNVTFIKSSAVVQLSYNGQPSDTITRTMYGQSPYIANGILSFNAEKIGLSATLSYNVQGPKLVFVTLTETQPDVFELPRNMLDFKIAKTLGKHFEIEFKIRDILRARTVWAYNYNNFELEYEGFNFGTSYVLSVAYRL